MKYLEWFEFNSSRHHASLKTAISAGDFGEFEDNPTELSNDQSILCQSYELLVKKKTDVFSMRIRFLRCRVSNHIQPAHLPCSPCCRRWQRPIVTMMHWPGVPRVPMLCQIIVSCEYLKDVITLI